MFDIFQDITFANDGSGQVVVNFDLATEEVEARLKEVTAGLELLIEAMTELSQGDEDPPQGETDSFGLPDFQPETARFARHIQVSFGKLEGLPGISDIVLETKADTYEYKASFRFSNLDALNQAFVIIDAALDPEHPHARTHFSYSNLHLRVDYQLETELLVALMMKFSDALGDEPLDDEDHTDPGSWYLRALWNVVLGKVIDRSLDGRVIRRNLHFDAPIARNQIEHAVASADGKSLSCELKLADLAHDVFFGAQTAEDLPPHHFIGAIQVA
nr:hypothetical protein [uncultured bacterium]